VSGTASLGTGARTHRFLTLGPTYWRDRFQADADAYAVTLGQTVVTAGVADAVRLRTYFGAVSAAVNKAGLDLGRQALLPAP
jgi:hypothetical protein